MKRGLEFWAFFVIESFVIPLITVYFGRVFEQMVKIFYGLAGL